MKSLGGQSVEAPAPTYVWTADAKIIRASVRRVS